MIVLATDWLLILVRVRDHHAKWCETGEKAVDMAAAEGDLRFRFTSADGTRVELAKTLDVICVGWLGEFIEGCCVDDLWVDDLMINAIARALVCQDHSTDLRSRTKLHKRSFDQFNDLITLGAHLETYEQRSGPLRTHAYLSRGSHRMARSSVAMFFVCPL